MKNFSCRETTHSHFFNVINGLDPLILSQRTFSSLFSIIRGHRPANLDPRVKPVDDNVERECVTSSNDNVERGIDHRKKNTVTFKGLDVVRQYAALLERRVQSSTRVRKAQAVTRQTNPIGRSMIEMLGVLAIIAVLSVGGIAGYSKAMERFKVNKLIQEYNDLIFGLLEYRQSFQKNIKDEQHLTDLIVSLNLVPSTWRKLNAVHLQDSLGNWVNTRYRPTNNSYDSFTKEGIIIDFNLGGLNIDEQGNKSSDNFNEKICFEMLNNIVQPLHQTIYGMLMVGGSGDFYYGDAYCNESRCLSNLTLTQMKEFCDSCDKTRRCNVTIVF